MDRLTAAVQLLNEQLDARIGALETEVTERMQTLDRLRSLRQVMGTVPLWESTKDAAISACLVVRDDEFGHLTMAEAAAELLSRTGRPMHAKEIWFGLMRGGYPHHSPSSFQALVTCLNRLKTRFRRVAPNVFSLAAAAGPAENPGAAAKVSV